MSVHRLDESHDGRTVGVRVGDRIELVLPENATTGFRWEVETPPAGVVVDSSEPVPPDQRRPGAAGQRRVVAHATAPGRSRLSLVLRRSWEPLDAAAQRYALDVDVT